MKGIYICNGSLQHSILFAVSLGRPAAKGLKRNRVQITG